MTFAIRTVGPPGTLTPAVQKAIHSLDPTQPLSRVMRLEDYVGLSVQGRRFSSILLAAFATIALLLSVLGIYGVTAYSAARTTRELGIRMGLGARQQEVCALLLAIMVSDSFRCRPGCCCLGRTYAIPRKHAVRREIH
jgi:putative ABC transport system permease protein